MLLEGIAQSRIFQSLVNYQILNVNNDSKQKNQKYKHQIKYIVI